jgi:multidrug efflux pump subunit AcrB
MYSKHQDAGMNVIYMTGISVSNAIILVDFARERIHRGED